MTYKGYAARIDFDERDNLFVGRVLGIRAIVDFHSATVDEVRQHFHGAIDHLIEDSRARGVEAEKPASAPLSTDSGRARVKPP